VAAAPRRSNYERMPSLPYIWWAIGLSLTAGLGQGTALFFHLAASQASGLWWVAAAQAHGHVQLFGWGGMFALGVALHFLPRLRGCPPPSPTAVRISAWLVGGGLTLRALTQPTVALLAPGTGRNVAGVGLALSGVAELAGVALAVGALIATARHGPALRHRAGLVAVLPFTLTFLVSLLLALTLNAVSLATDAQATGLVPGGADWLIVQFGLVGMLVSISAAVSARTFPLYLQLRVPPPRELYGIFAAFLAGFLLRMTFLLELAPPLDMLPALGAVLLGLSFLALMISLDVPFQRTKRELPGKTQLTMLHDLRGSSWLIFTAYGWLGVAGVMLVLDGLARWGVGWQPPQDAERHALGAGLVTLLILGMSVRMLPGFLGQKLYSVRLTWATLWLGNAAVLFRVAPLLLPSSRVSLGLLGLSGMLGLAAIACLGWNLWQTARGRAAA